MQVTLNVNFEAMEKKIEDLLRSTDLKESEIEWLKQELLNLHIVSVSFLYDFVNKFTDTEIPKEAIKETLYKLNER